MTSEINFGFDLNFDFYGLGQVQMSSEPLPEVTHSPTYPTALAFRFEGSDTRSALVLLDESLEFEMGKELGNILISKIAGELSAREGWEVKISPPQLWKQDRLQAFTHASVKLNFEFKLKDRTVLVPVLLFSGETIHV